MAVKIHGKKKILIGLLSLIVCLKFHSWLSASSISNTYEIKRHSTGRHLLAASPFENCDFEIKHARNYSDPSSWAKPPASAYGWVALYVILIIIIFVALAVVCDDFFVPSLEAISEKLDLSEDVAGATFMAAGSSAPELFTSIAGVTTESDVGVGTIVGSAIFNLLGICALSAAFAKSDLKLDWRPLTRDSMFYGASIGLFIIFAWDGKFEIYESVIMLCLYILYIVLMKFNHHLMNLMNRLSKRKVDPSERKKSFAPNAVEQKSSCPSATAEDGCKGNDENQDEHAPDEPKSRKFSQKKNSIADKRFLDQVNSLIKDNENALPTVAEEENENESQEDEEEDNRTRIVLIPCFKAILVDIPERNRDAFLGGGPQYVVAWILFSMAFPFIVLYTWTIPDCSTEKTRKFYLLSFIMSIFWIAALSFGTVTLVGRAGCILNIDKFTMGLVVVAIGTSIPDAMSSVLVAKQGYGDMAVSNAIGSNVFDIDLGIGLPFLISSLIRDYKPVQLMKDMEMVKQYPILPHVKFGFLLLVLLFSAISIFAAFRFRLSKKLGVSFIMLYVVFVGYAYVQDLVCDKGMKC